MMLNKTARPNQPLVEFGPNHLQQLANHKAFRPFVAAAALLASERSGGANAIAPITPISGSVTASSAQSMMRQSPVSNSAYTSAVLASSPATYFLLDDGEATTLDSSGHGYDVMMNKGRNSAFEPAKTISLDV